MEKAEKAKKAEKPGVISCEEPKWLDPKVKFYNNKNFIEILVFFVFESPCKKASARGIELSVYGWEDPWKKGKLSIELKDTSTTEKLMFSYDKYEKAKQYMEEAGLLNDFPCIIAEKICVYNPIDNQFMSTFKHIRNSISHGRFNRIIKDEKIWYIFEDVASEKLSARIILQEATLLQWIKIIKNGPRKKDELAEN